MLHGVEAEGAARNGVTHGSRHLLDLECLHQAQDLDELSLALFAHEVADGAPGHIRLATIQDFSAASLHGFVAANLAQGATIKPTDGQPIQARPTSLTIPMSSATWLPISCCHGSIACSPTCLT